MDAAALFACYHGKIGNLDRAGALGNDMLINCEHSPVYEPLRGDPRWEPFIAGVREHVARWKREFHWLD